MLGKPEKLPSEAAEKPSSMEPDSADQPTHVNSQPVSSPHANPPDLDRQLAGYHYTLPPDRIAQRPAVPRDSARMLVVASATDYRHSYFRDLSQFLQPGDLIIFNNTQVIPARLYGYKPTGAKIEVFLLEPRAPHQWLALVRPGKRLKPGSRLHFGPDPTHPTLTATIVATDAATNGRLITFDVPPGTTDLMALLSQLGQVPLPPYITNPEATPDQYQTIYASQPGAVAAPTAGLHFTPAVFEQLAQQGVKTAYVTLHVGLGTFRPVESAQIQQHEMHAERAELPPQTVDLIQQTKAQGHRVFAVGTTTVRTLEGVATQQGELMPFSGPVNLFIYPGYRWKVVDGLITNFHLPGSSLLMLVSSLVGRQRLMDLYEAAIAASYRFYSFGDAMLILPEATLPKGTH
ncbi:MAG: tRNA preQ1(34) S-adenosylmethionine ribosyltransferase-isomerase QueA [Cyanobacteria bacterium P01_A01_bin.105]